jgi:adenine-specific DNA methylase
VASGDVLQLPLDLADVTAADQAGTSALSGLFRPIHYLGSKLRLAPTIADALDSVDASRGPVLDLFAGSGTTALALASHRTVIAADIQEYSRVLCSALLCKPASTVDIVAAFERAASAGAPLLERFRFAAEPLLAFEQHALTDAARGNGEPICAILEGGSVLAAERGNAPSADKALTAALEEVVRRLSNDNLYGSSLMTGFRYFGGAYFSYAQALELDFLAATAAEFPKEFRDIFMAALLSTASDVVNTVGKQFAQPIRPRNKEGVIKRHLLAKIERDRRQDVRRVYIEWLDRYVRAAVPGCAHTAVRADYRDVLKELAGSYSVVYADPPYTRDHYSRFYHVLETLALRDNPAIARNPGAASSELSRGLYREQRHQSPFCIKSQSQAAFLQLFRLASQSSANLVVSYSPFETGAHPRLMQIDALVEMARQHYKSVELESVTGVAHSKLNHTSLNFGKPDEAEVLLICRLKR